MQFYSYLMAVYQSKLKYLHCLNSRTKMLPIYKGKDVNIYMYIYTWIIIYMPLNASIFYQGDDLKM